MRLLKTMIVVGTHGGVTKTFMLPKGTEIVGEVTRKADGWHFVALAGAYDDPVACVSDMEPVCAS